LDATSESRSGVAVASTDLDQAAVIWAELVRKKEEESAATKRGEREKRDSQEALTRVRQAMTQKLAQREQRMESEYDVESELAGGGIWTIDRKEEDASIREQERVENTDSEEEKQGRGRGGKQKREWKERAGAGLPAGKRQKLAQDQDESLIRALEMQDEKAGKVYRETLTAGIDKLVGAITQVQQPQSSASNQLEDKSKEIRDMTERLTRQEKQLSALAEKQLVVQQKLEEAVEQQTIAEKKNQELQQRMIELLEKLVGRKE